MLTLLPHLAKRKEADLLVFPFWEGVRGAQEAADSGLLKKQLMPPVKSKDFSGKFGETAFLYLNGQKEKRCLLLGLGKEEKLTVERLRLAYSEVPKVCQSKALNAVNVVVPPLSLLRTLLAEEVLEGVCEGIFLPNYRWEKLVSLDEETVLLKKVTLIGFLPKLLSKAKMWVKGAEGVHLCRDLINGNADDVTPQFLVKKARALAAAHPQVKVTIFDKKRLEKEKMGLLLAVGRGSACDPACIFLNYRGNPKSKAHTVIVGKGVTFDTGGLNLKPSGSMITMRDDMSGGATALSAVATAAALGLKCNATAVIPTTENSIDARSFKPGDVYQAYDGTTVEIGDTDAEGRLILADALAYAVKNLKPTRLIDVATLTGSAVVALGHEIGVLFANDDKMRTALLTAAQKSGETLWELPLFEGYNKKLKSDIADLKNVGGRPAGCITAALFLQNFARTVPWAHLDIAGPAFQSSEIGYWPKNGVGFGVRLLIHFLKNS